MEWIKNGPQFYIWSIVSWLTQNHSPSYNFTIHTSGSNHKPLKSVAHESSQTIVVGNKSGVWICWARDNENCASAPAVTRTSCASNWFRGRWRGNVKFYYLTHLSWFMIVISTRRGSTVHLLVCVVGLHGVPVDQVWPVGVDQGAECLARVILIRDL